MYYYYQPLLCKLVHRVVPLLLYRRPRSSALSSTHRVSIDFIQYNNIEIDNENLVRYL